MLTSYYSIENCTLLVQSFTLKFLDMNRVRWTHHLSVNLDAFTHEQLSKVVKIIEELFTIAHFVNFILFIIVFMFVQNMLQNVWISVVLCKGQLIQARVNKWVDRHTVVLPPLLKVILTDPVNLFT